MRRAHFICLLLAAIVIWMPRPAHAQEKKEPRVRPDTKVNQILDSLEQEYARNNFSDNWAGLLKDLIEVGPAAVPDLIAELDATDSDIMLRNLGFAARAIGDKRIVPALIRALPKTLRKPGSDMGLRASDKDLFAFMQKHDLDEKDSAQHYGFGRPIREIGGALQKLTGSKQGEEQIFGVFKQGGPHQQRMQAQLYRRCAERWEAWWQQNWQQHVTDKKYATVGLPNDDSAVAQLFPQGPTVKIGGHSSGHTVVPDTDSAAKREVFYDVDTGRESALPAELKSLADDPHRLDKIHAWAAREGFDLMGTLYQAAGGKTYYAIRGLGLTAWEIDAARFAKIDDEITSDKPLTIGPPAGGLLLKYDEQTKQYDPVSPAAFLFVSREGTYGVLLVGVEVLDTNVVLGVPAQGEEAMNPVGFRKGRRFSVKIVAPAEVGDAK